MDDRGEFFHVEDVKPGGDAPGLGTVDPRAHATAKMPQPPAVSA